MYEIELKAWLYDYAAAHAALTSFATYCGRTEKHDRYYARTPQQEAPDNGRTPPVQIRIREETGKPVTATYKRKEVRNGSIEVNDEKEFTVSAAEPLECFLADAGFAVSVRKHKTTDTWKCRSPYGTATVELSAVENLGQFIEIEIISETDLPETTALIRQELLSILARCGVPESQIETRYYSELLREKIRTDVPDRA